MLQGRLMILQSSHDRHFRKVNKMLQVHQGREAAALQSKDRRWDPQHSLYCLALFQAEVPRILVQRSKDSILTAKGCTSCSWCCTTAAAASQRCRVRCCCCLVDNVLTLALLSMIRLQDCTNTTNTGALSSYTHATSLCHGSGQGAITSPDSNADVHTVSAVVRQKQAHTA